MNRGMQPLMGTDIPVDLTNCDLEPIHIPSLIQAHGMLLAARNSDLRVVYTSANSLAMMGVTPEFILEHTLTDILGGAAVAAIEAALGRETYAPRNICTLCFAVSGDRRYEVTAHRTHGLLCVELEPALEPRCWDLVATHLETAMRVLSGKTLDELYAAIPPLVRELTGYDRVMVYKFDADGHGEVVAEDKAAEMEPFLGLHYPATDIPRQARKLYLQQRFRTIVDVNYIPVALLGNRDLIHDEPLDMTFCSLRSTSPIHIEYLQNMGVGASLAVSLILNGELWGMVVGHHRTSKHLPPESRSLCDLLGQFISLVLGSADKAAAELDYHEKKSLLDRLSGSIEREMLAFDDLTDSSETLLRLVHADGAVVRLGGQLTLLGATPGLAESTALLDAFQDRFDGEFLASHAVGDLFPAFAHLASQASGALFVPFQQPSEGILWLRGEIAQTVRWAGKPDASKQYFEGSIRLSPRKSFAQWEEVQQGRSLPWLAAEIEAALGMQRIAARALLLRSEANLFQLRRTDPLTGLGNRLALLERKARWRANDPQAPGALLFLDLDEFRAINDRYGHPVGDEFLRWTGMRLTELASVHFVCRLAGDEFAIFCEDTSLAEAEDLAMAILEGLAEPFHTMDIPITSTASIGIAAVDSVVDAKASDPLRIADSAMYVAKHKGGNQVSIVESREHADMLRAAVDQEIVAHRLAADELATSYARLNSVLESTSDNVITIGVDWTMLYANSKAKEELPELKIGASYWSCFPSVLGTPTEALLRTVMSERSERRYEIFYTPSLRWYSGKIFPFAEGISVFFSDITEERQIEEQLALEQLHRDKRTEALSHMAAGLAHEISNPLAIIHGLVGELAQRAQAETPVDPQAVRLACQSILKTANRASNILRGLRGFAREEAQLPKEFASIYEIVDQCLELQQARLERHHVDVTMDMAPGIPLILCREVQIGQILTNLVNNAFDAITQSDSSEYWIEVSVKPAGDQVCIDVTDSGPGIEDHFRAHLMEPFFTTKELGLGMGVGLSLSRVIAQDHGGTLTLLEDAVHTTFRLTLPLAAGPAETAPSQVLEGAPA